MTRHRCGAVGLAVAAFVVMGCPSSDSVDDQTSPGGLFSGSINTVRIEVDYMTSAEPYTGPIAEGRPDTWTLFGENAERLFPPESKTVEYPTTLEEMESIGPSTQPSYSVSEILRLAEEHRDWASEGSVAAFYFLWIDGYFRSDDGVQPGVLGVSIGDTEVVAMFKPVVAGAAALPSIERFVEQTTLIHEFGHAIGLVNNGIPLSVDHHDVENGAHCTNRSCVMYWALESVADVVEFAQNLDETGSRVVFGPDCLSDVDAASGR